MRKFLTSLAILVLSLQTVLPNFLYAQESTLLEGGETLEQNIITEQNEVIEVPSCIEGQILDEDTWECVELIVLDEGEDVVPVLPSPEQPAEKAEPEGSIAPVPVQTLNTPLQLLAAPIQTLATTCPADLDGIKDALLAPLTTNPNLDYLSIIMSNFPIAGPALDKLLAGIYISDAELQAIDAILSQLQHIDFGNLADAVDAFAANLTGDFTTCTVAYLTGQGLNASLVNLTVVPYIKALSHILTTPNTTEYPKIAAENRYNFGLSMVLRAMDTKVDTLTNNPKLSEIIPLLSGLIEDMTHIDYLLNQQGHIYSSGSKAKNNVIGHEGIISALSGLNAYFNTTKLSITPQITGALTDIITPLETINQQTFVKVNTLLTTNGIAGLTGLATLLNDAQPAFTHLEAFFDAVQAQDRSTALTIAETDLLDDIDDFKNHLVGQKLLPIVQILAEAGVTELETRGRINTNGANQIKQGITDLLDPNQNTKTVLKALIQTLTATLNTNAIDAPTANNLACSATSGTVATGATTTLQLTAPANANEAWGYLAIVGNPDTTTGLYLLAGDLTDLELPTPNTGTYTVELMTIGKNNILNPASVWANVSGRGNAMPYTWKTITDKISGKISSLSTVPATRQSRITAALSLLESTILRTSVTTTLLSGVQNILKTRIAYINANAGQWIAVNENGYLKASEALELWEEINTLAKGGDTKGNFIASLLNPTEIITIKKTSTPIVDDVEVIGFSWEELTIQLSGTDLDGNTLTYVVEGDPVISNNSFTGSYSTGIVLTYTGYKTVDCLQVADTGTITITVFPLPSIENVNLNGYVNDPFSTALTGQNLTGTLTWYVSGTALSGNSYTGNYPATAGTTTVKYKVCLDVTGLPQQCSDEATITIKSNIRGGGGGGSSIVRDVCPNEDTSGSYYDGKCSVDTDETETVLSGDVAEVIEQPVSTAKCSIEGSKYDDETNAAYLYACENDITTQRTIQDARLDDLLTRAENAKLISNYAMIVLGKTPDTTKDCSNFYDSIQSYKNTDLYDAMITSCQLDIMGINPDKTPIPDFMGAYPLERRDFGTVFSRLLRGNVNEYKGEKYWDGHLQALKDAEIITNLNRSMNEYRSRIFLQIYRSTQK